MRIRIAFFVFLISTLPLKGEEPREFTLSLADEIAESGLADYILPRFALKTGRRATIVIDGADARLEAAEGEPPIMARGDDVYALVLEGENEAARRFADWLGSEIGQNTLAAFQPADGVAFGPPPEVSVRTAVKIEGDADLGREVAEAHCARCHRIAPEMRGMTLGSTPSFAALKTLPDWSERFSAFYALNPHPSFLLVEGISPPFDPSRPPPIVPVEVTPEEVEALLAYVAGVAAADLGAAIESR
ncbi:cytochrome c [Defluviimonas sp. WL0050]|uniref:Cytochrome c n=1 Tax=Albidovulum litorale TaxID=2984134 RepID=A0ABT2ZIB8_9RHOB|nr:cytochrome c [Defluviimonas sp. WL0050]MCV2870866.1 cytochrome c [Defluviimonas sp. WL0050]